MLTHILVRFFVVKLAAAQLNGEFWWLHDKLTKYNHVKPSPPKFEDISEFETDESVKVVFKDDNSKASRVLNTFNVNTIYTDKASNFNIKNSNINNEKLKDQVNKTGSGDRFAFKFPEEDNFVLFATEKNIRNNTVLHSYDVLNINKTRNLSEDICTYMEKNKCYQNSGKVQKSMHAKETDIDSQLICCVSSLPKKQEFASPFIFFPDSPREIKRHKRENSETKIMKQRNVLLQRRYDYSLRKATTQKIVTVDDEYDDPYANIKTFKNSNKKQQTNKKHNYRLEDYEEEYLSEIPRPGLVGLYSDYLYEHAHPSWSTSNENTGHDSDYVDVNYDDEDTPTFGYATIDPRTDTNSKLKTKIIPMTITPPSEEVTHDADSQTISYHSVPNYNVLQDFKLFINKNRVFKPQRGTAVHSIINDSKESLVNADAIDTDDHKNQQVYQDCGKAVHVTNLHKQDTQIGKTVNGAHPWLALVVPTRRLHSVLCYATLIHPRAALATARCVYRKSPGEITLRAGLWDLNELARSKRRAVDIQLHPEYRHRRVNNNLAILRWNRPLELGDNVQPACLGDPQFGDTCLFFGWGGFDQEMKHRPRWQKALVHSCKGIKGINEDDLPNDAFCATVLSRSTVTGTGGPLMCNMEGRLTAIGVAVARDSTITLLPIHKWTLSVMSSLED